MEGFRLTVQCLVRVAGGQAMRVPASWAIAVVGWAVAGCTPGGGVLNPRPEDPGATAMSGTGGASAAFAGAGGVTGSPVVSKGADAGLTAPPRAVADAGARADSGDPDARPPGG
jgi:hypothetical protein